MGLLNASWAALLLLSTARADDAVDAALARLRGAAPADRSVAIEAAASLGVPASRWLAAMRAGPTSSEPAAEVGWSLRSVEVDGAATPYQLYVPASVSESGEPCPLLVHLHGAVSRAEFTTEIGRMGYGERLWLEAAQERCFAIAYPLGKRGWEWWSARGRSNVSAVIRDVKRFVDVDDERVIATGFSDGASGCYYLAMTGPDPFAGFIPMNGHPAVASSASGGQLYPRNMAGVPTIACMTEDDVLYPAATVLPHLLIALRAGGGFHVVSYPTGGHQPAYFEHQSELLLDFIADTRRDTWPSSVEWTCATPNNGRRWLTVTELGTRPGDAPLPELGQVMTEPGRIRFGFSLDRTVDRVRLEQVTGGGTADALGLRPGDVIIGVNGDPVSDVTQLSERLQGATYGDAVSFVVERGTESVTIDGTIPPFQPEPIYLRDSASAWVRVTLEQNRVDIRSAGVAALRLLLNEIYLAPGELEVWWNGESVSGSLLPPDTRWLLARYAAEADAAALPDLILDLP